MPSILFGTLSLSLSLIFNGLVVCQGIFGSRESSKHQRLLLDPTRNPAEKNKTTWSVNF